MLLIFFWSAAKLLSVPLTSYLSSSSSHLSFSSFCCLFLPSLSSSLRQSGCCWGHCHLSSWLLLPLPYPLRRSVSITTVTWATMSMTTPMVTSMTTRPSWAKRRPRPLTSWPPRRAKTDWRRFCSLERSWFLSFCSNQIKVKKRHQQNLFYMNIVLNWAIFSFGQRHLSCDLFKVKDMRKVAAFKYLHTCSFMMFFASLWIREDLAFSGNIYVFVLNCSSLSYSSAQIFRWHCVGLAIDLAGSQCRMGWNSKRPCYISGQLATDDMYHVRMLVVQLESKHLKHSLHSVCQSAVMNNSSSVLSHTKQQLYHFHTCSTTIHQVCCFCLFCCCRPCRCGSIAQAESDGTWICQTDPKHTRHRSHIMYS